MNENLICTICDGLNALIYTFQDGRVMVACKKCLDLGLAAFMEKKAFGSELNIFKPETFRDKPASSLLWLYTYAKIHPMIRH